MVMSLMTDIRLACTTAGESGAKSSPELAYAIGCVWSQPPAALEAYNIHGAKNAGRGCPEESNGVMQSACYIPPSLH